MAYFYFLLALSVASLATVFADDSGKDCPYYGTPDQQSIEELKSEEFQTSLSDFQKMFLKAIPSEGFYLKLFDTSFPKDEIKRVYFLNCVYWEIEMADECAKDLCKDLADKVKKAYDENLSRAVYLKIVSGTLERTMKEKFGEGLDKNETLAYINSFIQDVAHFLCRPEVKAPAESLFSMDKGAMKFYTKLGVSGLYESGHIVELFGNAFANKGNQDPDYILKIDL